MCVIDPCYIEKLIGYTPGQMLGWVEHDGITGASNDSEIVYAGDAVEDGVVLHISCNECICSDGLLTCTNKRCTGCAYSTWTPWTLCSKSCDNGNRIRTRSVATGKGTEACNLPTEESADCNFIPCESEPSWSTWGQWSTCSLTCGKGQQTRRRDCTNELGNSNKCSGTGLQIQYCLVQNCSASKECSDGKIWSECSNGCQQTCAEEKMGAEICQQSDSCIPGCKCSTGFLEQDADCVLPENCHCYDKFGNTIFKNFQTPIHDECETCTCSTGNIITCTNTSSNCCPYSEWTDWGSCSKTCGVGIKHRYRKLKVDNVNCGEEYLFENSTCTLGTCPHTCFIDGHGYNDLELIREDICKICYCESYNETCYEQPTSIIDGNWAVWGEWSACSDSCQPGGFRQRYHSCSNPLPQCGGKECVGSSIESESCNEDKKCCTYDAWSFWSSCDSNCGNGQQTRERKASNTSFCKIDTEIEKQACQVEPCDATCGQWNAWSTCDGDCGKGISIRTFIISENQKSNSVCKSFTEEKECYLQKECSCTEAEEISSTADCEHKCGIGFQAPSISGCKTFKYGCKCKHGLYRNTSGYCVPKENCNLFCRVGESVKMDKEMWTDPTDNCSKCECIGGNVKCQRICKIPVCSRNKELFYPEFNPCCPVCKLKSEKKCQKKSLLKFLKSGNESSQCISVEKVKVSYCSGHCAEGSSEAILMSSKPQIITGDMFKNKCECCQAKALKIKAVVVLCGPEQKENVMYYPKVCSCECSTCA